MKFHKTTTLIATLGLSIALPMAATANPFLGVNYTRAELDGDVDAGFNTLSLRAGYEFTNWLAIEARYGAGLDRDNSREQVGPFSVDIKYEVEHYYGAYGRLTLPNDTPFKPYIIAGYTEAELEGTGKVGGIRVGKVKAKGDAFSYGAGVNLDLSERLFVNAEYMRLLDEDDVEVDGFTLGVSYRF